MWIGLLSRFWPWLAVAVALSGAALLLNHAGYKSGYAASEARWQRAFVAAEHARDEANARAAVQEANSKALSDQIEKQHAQTVASLNLRAADAERRITGLLRQRPASSRCSSMPEAGRPATEPDAIPSGDELADRTGNALAQLARRCEADASALGALQQWVLEQRALRAP